MDAYDDRPAGGRDGEEIVDGALRLAVLFASRSSDGAPIPTPRIEPLGRWA